MRKQNRKKKIRGGDPDSFDNSFGDEPRNKKNPAPPIENLDDFFNALFGGFMRGMAEAVQPPIQASVPPEMFRKLMMLCHPDKHGNSELSQEVTRWLIEERKKGTSK